MLWQRGAGRHAGRQPGFTILELSVAMLLRHSCGAEAAARDIETAVLTAIRSGARTRDIAAPAARDWLGTRTFTDAVLKHLAAH